MAEAGGPSIAEVQAQPVGAVDRVKSKLREVLTSQGRAEVMAQKQIDAILVQVPEDKRVEAMQILESKRPEFVAGKMEDAKGSLVRDAVVGVAVVGGVGVGFWKRKEIGGLVGKGAGKVFEKMPQKAQGVVLQVGGKIGEARGAVDKFSGGLKGRVEGAMSWIKGKLRPGVKAAPRI